MELSKKQAAVSQRFAPRAKGIAWWRVGTGKTRLSFATIREMPDVRRILIICRPAAFGDWKDEAEMCGLHIRWREFGRNCHIPVFKHTLDVWLVSHGSLMKYADEINDTNIHVVIADELFLYKNASSGRSKALASLHCVQRFGLSGSIMTARDLCDVWGQAKAVGLEHLLARNLTEFRSRYLIRVPIGERIMWVPRHGAKQKIMEILKPWVSIYFPKGRPAQHIIKKIDASKEQEKIMRDLRSDYFAEFKDFDVEIRNALSLSLKVQQIADGWIISDAGQIQQLKHNPKLEYLKGLVDEIVEGGDRVVIWCAFRHDVDLILQQLQRPAVGMTGSIKFDTEKWKTAKVAVATEASGSSVNHFAECRYAIYFSQNYNWLDMQQSRGRTDRGARGKHTDCIYYYLHLKGGVDRYVYDVAKHSGKEEEELKGYIQQWLTT